MKIPEKDSRDFIVWLFRGRCVVCYGPGSDVNEIEPKSRGKRSLRWQNKVLMCRSCHDDYHANGTSFTAIDKLRQRRTEVLIAMGREEYVE